MPGTIFGLPFDEELFIQMWSEEPDPIKSAMIDSGAMVEDGTIGNRIQSDGNLYTIPFYSPLDGDPSNHDGQTDIIGTEIKGGSQSGIVYGRNKSFFARNFTAELSGADPMGHITGTIAKYWHKVRQKEMMRILTAIFGITGAASSLAKAWSDTHIVNLGSDTATPRKIGETDLNDLATLSMGDGKSSYGLAFMHSNVANTLENKQLLEYWKQTDPNGLQRSMNIASMSGYTVIIDDNVPVKPVGGAGANKDLLQYSTLILGNGVLRHANGRADVPSEVYRNPNKNGGQDELITRIRETVHPNGFSFKIPSSNWSESPTSAQLADKANWEIKFNPKAIPIAELITNG